LLALFVSLLLLALATTVFAKMVTKPTHSKEDLKRLRGQLRDLSKKAADPNLSEEEKKALSTQLEQIKSQLDEGKDDSPNSLRDRIKKVKERLSQTTPERPNRSRKNEL